MKKNNIVIITFTIMSFVLLMVAFVFGGILDQVATALNITVAESGLLNSMYLYGAAIGTPIILFVFRKINRVRLLKISLGVTIISTLALIMATSFHQMLLIRLIMGIAANSYGALAIATLMSITPKERQGRAMALFIMGGSLALVFGIPLTRILSTVLDWKGIFWILIGLMLFSLTVFVSALKNDHQAASKIDIKEELKLIREPMALNVIIYSFIVFIGYGAFYTYITPYFILLFPSTESLMSIMLVLLGIAGFLGNLLGGRVADKIGYRKAMGFGALWQLVTIGLIVVTQGLMWLNIIISILWLAGAWFTGLQVNTGIVQATHNKSNFVISINSSANQLGTAVGSSLSAFFIHQSGIGSIVYIALISVTLVTILHYLFMKIGSTREIVLVESN